MFGSGVVSRLKQVDVYRKMPADLTEPTLSGALVSIISLSIMVILFISELHGYLQVQELSEMYVDVARGSEKIRVNLDVEFPYFPCDILSLDAQDIMGSHHVNLEGNLYKQRLDVNGKVIEKIKAFSDEHTGHTHDQSNQVSIDKVNDAFKAKEGCQLVGYIMVNKVPGNFHVSSHAFTGILPKVFAMNNLQTVDLSHKINHISFGDDIDLRKIKKQFSQGVLNPVDGMEKKKPSNLKDVGIMHQYYINVVPTTYVENNGKSYHVYQFTANSNELHTHNLPAAYFRYDLSPVTVKFSQQKESFFHFLVQVCAIVGGVFTVAGIVDSLIHRSVVAILKKHQLGKL